MVHWPQTVIIPDADALALDEGCSSAIVMLYWPYPPGTIPQFNRLFPCLYAPFIRLYRQGSSATQFNCIFANREWVSDQDGGKTASAAPLWHSSSWVSRVCVCVDILCGLSTVSIVRPVWVLETNGARPTAGTVVETNYPHFFFTKFIFADETTSKLLKKYCPRSRCRFELFSYSSYDKYFQLIIKATT